MAKRNLQGLIDYEHIEICSVCGERYLEKLPKQRGVRYLCLRCFAKPGEPDLTCPYCGKAVRVELKELEE